MRRFVDRYAVGACVHRFFEEIFIQDCEVSGD